MRVANIIIQAGILSGRYDLDGVEQDETNALKVSLIGIFFYFGFVLDFA